MDLFFIQTVFSTLDIVSMETIKLGKLNETHLPEKSTIAKMHINWKLLEQRNSPL